MTDTAPLMVILSPHLRIAPTNQFIYSISDDGANLTYVDAKRRMEETLRHNAERPLFAGPAVSYFSSHVTWRSFMSFSLAGACSRSSTPRLQFSSLSGQYTLSFGQKVYASSGDHSPHPRCMWAVVLQSPRPILNRIQVL